MAYNDGWRVCENTAIKREHRLILMISEASIKKDLRVQEATIKVITEKAKRMPLNVSVRVRSKMNGRLQNECEQRDRLLRRLEIVEEWIKEVEK